MSRLRLSDFIIAGKNVPIEIADKIIEYHMIPIGRVQEIHKGIITVSQRSGYRSPIYEKKHGRSGTGQHTYIGKGATDYATTGSLEELLDDIVEKTDYTRLSIYIESNFIHADYYKTDGYVHLYKYSTVQHDWIKYDKQRLKRRTHSNSNVLKKIRKVQTPI
jgi:hypothetical protein